ncbi:hypothetical protein BDAP_001711 [Binucleata daphniae]
MYHLYTSSKTVVVPNDKVTVGSSSDSNLIVSKPSVLPTHIIIYPSKNCFIAQGDDVFIIEHNDRDTENINDFEDEDFVDNKDISKDTNNNISGTRLVTVKKNLIYNYKPTDTFQLKDIKFRISQKKPLTFPSVAVKNSEYIPKKSIEINTTEGAIKGEDLNINEKSLDTHTETMPLDSVGCQIENIDDVKLVKKRLPIALSNINEMKRYDQNNIDDLGDNVGDYVCDDDVCDDDNEVLESSSGSMAETIHVDTLNVKANKHENATKNGILDSDAVNQESSYPVTGNMFMDTPSENTYDEDNMVRVKNEVLESIKIKRYYKNDDMCIDDMSNDGIQSNGMLKNDINDINDLYDVKSVIKEEVIDDLMYEFKSDIKEEVLDEIESKMIDKITVNVKDGVGDKIEQQINERVDQKIDERIEQKISSEVLLQGMGSEIMKEEEVGSSVKLENGKRKGSEAASRKKSKISDEKNKEENGKNDEVNDGNSLSDEVDEDKVSETPSKAASKSKKVASKAAGKSKKAADINKKIDKKVDKKVDKMVDEIVDESVKEKVESVVKKRGRLSKASEPKEITKVASKKGTKSKGSVVEEENKDNEKKEPVKKGRKSVTKKEAPKNKPATKKGRTKQ